MTLHLSASLPARTWIATFFSGLIASLAFGCATHPVTVSAVDSASRNTIVVLGRGEASGEPDMATIRLGVEARAPDAKTAVEQTNQQMERIIAALKSRGIQDADLQTENLSLHSERDHEEPPRPLGPTPEGPTGTASQPAVRTYYRASNQLVVKLRDLTAIGETLGKAIEAGANSVFGLGFEIDDTAPLRERARVEAMTDARAQAEQLARLANVRLGRVLSISESGADTPGPMPHAAYEMAASRAVPMESGQVTHTQMLRVVYAIERAGVENEQRATPQSAP